MQIGRLRHKVMIQHNTPAADGKGGFTDAWADVESVWAEVSPMSSRERFYHGQVDADLTHRVTMRYTSNLTMESRIVHDGRVFHVVGIRDLDERRRTIEARCKEEQP